MTFRNTRLVGIAAAGHVEWLRAVQRQRIWGRVNAT